MHDIRAFAGASCRCWVKPKNRHMIIFCEEMRAILVQVCYTASTLTTLTQKGRDHMATRHMQGSAKILQFPVRMRTNVNTMADKAKSPEDLRWMHICEAALDGCIYHEAAVREADRV